MGGSASHDKNRSFNSQNLEDLIKQKITQRIGSQYYNIEFVSAEQTAENKYQIELLLFDFLNNYPIRKIFIIEIII